MSLSDDCKHKRIKKNYPFGRKSKPLMSCKDCGAVVRRKRKKKKRVSEKKKGGKEKHGR